ncbi:TPA: hypothetical protein L7578_004134 [Klebsiella pneumoniae subsp. pneumoniae]|uniref:hypothetical protein n=1 Tax=Klebsiella TaxID=570 RepID=UPI000E2CB44F|nr:MULTISPECIES: hypothetical protein [Klebsiella]HBQ5691400.1 hypothetical protein [Klebsiella pneumoniae subsp. pneumoniae]MDE8419340.1 hypothetical protein [Klebsiella pneumoniae]MEC4495550.1 hypothetical protein [Klebsiella pneumoniae]NRG07552.1 hypothetical protein [Klebsiella variicola]UDC94747.1 hypothetical protein LGM18_26050 [Klebsiella pneumoniae]
MSYYNKKQTLRLTSVSEEKKVMQELVRAELVGSISNTEAFEKGFKDGLNKAKKHSSATLLRRKLKTTLVREYQEI